MNKKGFELTIFTLIESLLIFLVIIAFTSYIVSLRNDTLIEKTAIARDLSMLANTVQASPHDVVVLYNSANKLINTETLDSDNSYLSKYHFSFGDTIIRIKEQDFTSLGYPYYNNLYFGQILQDIEKQNKMVFSLFKNSFIISSEPIIGTGLQELNRDIDRNIDYGKENNAVTNDAAAIVQKKLSCNDIQSNIRVKSIILDASKGYYIIDESVIDGSVIDKSHNDNILLPEEAILVQIKGVKNDNFGFIEQELTYKAITALENKLIIKFPKVLLKKTRNSISPTKEYTIEKRTDNVLADASLMLSIRMYKSNENNNEITLYIIAGKNEEQNKKFACLLANNLAEKVKGLTAPINIEYLAKTDDDYLLLNKNGENLAVIIQLGNINILKNLVDYQLEQSVNAINQAIEAYDS